MFASYVIAGWLLLAAVLAETRRDWVSIVRNKLENIFEMDFSSWNLIITFIYYMTCDDGKLVDILLPHILPYIVRNGNESLKFCKANSFADGLPTGWFWFSFNQFFFRRQIFNGFHTLTAVIT